ncbi:MAG: hypothetical protein LH650_12820 [Chloroflexi bacterium]|nr:hypothetical protein [Chloroflexota bacterium]
MTQQVPDVLQREALRQHQRRRGMPEVMEPALGNPALGLLRDERAW